MNNTAKQIVLPAMVGALMLIGQITLNLIANVEVVTLIVIVSAFVFPPSVSVTAAFIFCTGEMLFYGVGYWVVAYYIYWPFLAVISLTLKLIKKNWLRNIVATMLATICTALFGLLTSFVDAVLISDSINFFTAFKIIYLRGGYFYITHIVSNCVIISLLFMPLSLALKRKKRNS